MAGVGSQQLESLMLGRRTLLSGVGALAAGRAWAEPCGEDERRRLLKFSLIDEAYACGGGSVVGPAANSAFLTADFTSKYFYPTPGTTTQNSGRGQMVISPRLWGVIDGAFANDGSQVNSFSDTTNGNPFALLTSPTYQSRMATVSPGLWTEVTPPPTIWANNIWTGGTIALSANAFTNLVNNFYKLDPLQVSAIILNLNWWDDSRVNILSLARYGQAIHLLATTLANQVMPNSKRLPVIGFTGQNEPNNADDIYGYYNTITANVKNVTLPGGGTYLVSGPTWRDVFPTGGWNGFTQNVPNIDILTWDNFPNGSNQNLSMATLQTSLATYFSDGILSHAAPAAVYQPLAYAPTGNMDSSMQEVAAADYRGAMWDALTRVNCANSSPVQAYWQKWDSANQSNGGFLLDPGPLTADQISPAGYANGKGIRTTTGPRWNVVSNAAGLRTIACTPSAGHMTLYVVNTGQGAQNSKLVALSHWPVNTSGNGTANVWQMTSASTGDGVSSTIPVVNGVTTTNAAWPNGLDFPDPSITTISI